MFFSVDAAMRRRARSPHEWAMVNLLLVNLLLLIALLAGSFLPRGSPLKPYRWFGVLIPLVISLGMMSYTFLRAKRAVEKEAWFVALHWHLSSLRYRILLITYGLGAGLIGIGWLLSLTQRQPGMQELMFLALQRVAIAPLLLVLMVLIVLESGALYQAGRGEAPDGLVERFPPPDRQASQQRPAEAP